MELAPDANFKGKKPFACAILIAADLEHTDVRWRTLIHEALHAVSTGYVQSDFEANRGWEEGVVEKLQRLIGPSVLLMLGVDVANSLSAEIEDDHAFNIYIGALESIRITLHPDDIGIVDVFEQLSLMEDIARGKEGAAIETTSLVSFGNCPGASEGKPHDRVPR